MSPIARYAQCLEVIRCAPPLSRDERAFYESEKARVRAEDERRREPTPQLELGQGGK